MGRLIEFPRLRHRHAQIPAGSGGYRSGLNSCRGTPVSRSIGNTNSPGTPRLERESQYQTCDCVVPIRSASGFCPPATSHARLSASVDDMSPFNRNMGESQPKNLSTRANRIFGSMPRMRKVESKAFGDRVRERREELGLTQKQLGDLAGYGQQTIVYYESGRIKRPQRCAMQLADALATTVDWLLYREGPRAVGPKHLSIPELVEKYRSATLEDRARVSKILDRPDTSRRKSG